MADESQAGGVREIGRTVQGLGLGERLVVLGAGGVLVVWLVFGLLTREYGVGQVPFALAAAALFLAYRFHVQKAVDWPVAYPTLMLALGMLLGLIGVREFLLDMRYEAYDAGADTFIGAILFWVAAIAAGVGAWLMGAARR